MKFNICYHLPEIRNIQTLIIKIILAGTYFNTLSVFSRMNLTSKTKQQIAIVIFTYTSNNKRTRTRKIVRK